MIGEVQIKPYLSYSRLSTFLKCPKQYEFKYIKNIIAPPSGAMMQSRVWHETLETNYRQKIKTKKDLDIYEMVALYEKKFKEAFKEDVVLNGQSYDDLLTQGIKITEIHHEFIAPHVQPVSIEQKFTVSLGDEFPFNLLGIWDVIDEDGTIIDNKAYSKTPSQADVDSDLQLTLYALGYRLLNKKNEKGLRLDCVIKNKKLKTIQLSTSRTIEQCRWMLKMIEGLVSAIETDIFYPNPTGWHCSKQYCYYFDMCKENGGKNVCTN